MSFIVKKWRKDWLTVTGHFERTGAITKVGYRQSADFKIITFRDTYLHASTYVVIAAMELGDMGVEANFITIRLPFGRLARG